MVRSRTSNRGKRLLGFASILGCLIHQQFLGEKNPKPGTLRIYKQKEIDISPEGRRGKLWRWRRKFAKPSLNIVEQVVFPFYGQGALRR